MSRKFFFGTGMSGTNSGEVTQLLRAWACGSPAALDQLTQVVYQELRRLARKYMKNERAGNTLASAALVNEVYLRLVDLAAVDWKDRAHFFAIAAKMMRRILVDGARARGSDKRGGQVLKVNVDDAPVLAAGRDAQTIALDDALQELAKLDPRKEQVIELRYYAGLSVEETAEVLGVSPQTVMRDWKLAKAWLMREMGAPEEES